MVIGVLGLQGSVAEYITMINRGGDTSVLVKDSKDLDNISLLVIPGGESTTISKLLKIKNLDKAIVEKIKNGLAVWGTCAGLILLSEYFELLDISVERNGYGSQLNSFEENISVGDKKLSVKFIRAPKIVNIKKNVSIIARNKQEIVAVRDKNIFGTTFHTETGEDLYFYEYVKSQIRN